MSSLARRGWERKKPPVGSQVDWGHPRSQGLVGCWLFNEGGGDRVKNLSMLTATDGTINAGPTWTTGPFGGSALNIGATSGPITISGSIPFASGQPYTMAGLVNLATAGSSYFLSMGGASTNQGPHFGNEFGAAWRFAIWGDGVIDVGIAITNAWRYLVGTYDGTNGRLYVDGVLVGGPTAFTFTGTDGSVRLGGLNNGAGGWNGKIDHLQIYNRALTPAEILDAYVSPFAHIWRPGVRRWFVGTAGGTTYNLSLSESLANSDAFSRIANGIRLYSDNFGALEAYARLSNANRSLSDTVGVADAFARVADALRSLSDTLGTQDAYTRTAAALRVFADNLGTTEAYDRLSNANRSLSDSLGVAEAYARQSDALRALADSLGLSEAYARLSDANRSLTDTLGVADAYSRVSDALRALTDTLGLADAATLELVTAGVFTIAVIDTLGLVDAYARTADANRSLSDTLALSDTFARVADAVRAYAESLGLADAEQSVVQWGRGLSDSVGVAEAYARQSDALRALTESLGLTEAYARRADAYRVFTDTLGLADVIAAQLAGVLGPLIFEAALAFCAGAEAALAFTPGAEAGLSFTSGAEAALVEP